MAKMFKPKPEVVVICGIPAIGKSYIVENFFPYHQRINLDSIRDILSEDGFYKRNFGLARTIEDLIIEDRLNKKIPIVVDNTNVTKAKREKYINVAGKYGVDVKAVYFEPDTKLAVSRNDERIRKVPKIAVYSMAKSFQVPEKSEGFSSVYKVEEIGSIFGKNPAIFLDRDGVIIKNKINGKDHYVNKIEDIIFYDNSINALKKLNDKGYCLFIVSNQAGVSYGYMSEKDLDGINNYLRDVLLKNRINIKGIFCCTHPKEIDCKCRKPKTGMIIQAAYENDVDLSSSYLIGDMTTDIELGNRLNLKTILVETGFGGADKKYETKPNQIVKDIYEAANIVSKISA